MSKLVTVTGRGMTTIPAAMLRKYRIQKGTKLEVIEQPDGILLKPLPTLRDLYGVNGKQGIEMLKKHGLQRLEEIDHDNKEL